LVPKCPASVLEADIPLQATHRPAVYLEVRAFSHSLIPFFFFLLRLIYFII
jgi:hypothetical protein